MTYASKRRFAKSTLNYLKFSILIRACHVWWRCISFYVQGFYPDRNRWKQSIYSQLIKHSKWNFDIWTTIFRINFSEFVFEFRDECWIEKKWLHGYFPRNSAARKSVVITYFPTTLNSIRNTYVLTFRRVSVCFF